MIWPSLLPEYHTIDHFPCQEKKIIDNLYRRAYGLLPPFHHASTVIASLCVHRRGNPFLKVLRLWRINNYLLHCAKRNVQSVKEPTIMVEPKAPSDEGAVNCRF